jgi:hypothetical protein
MNGNEYEVAEVNSGWCADMVINVVIWMGNEKRVAWGYRNHLQMTVRLLVARP